jgi:omega-6 fatty acid desaturase (delta-12 desaturase)
MKGSPIKDDINRPVAIGSPDLRRVLIAHRGSHWGISLTQLGLTIVLFALSWWCMWCSLTIGYWATLLMAVPTAGLLVRLFILQHDCGHGSLFSGQSANRFAGILLSALTVTPYECWRRQHARHHATNAQLDHRGMGDVLTLTLSEYIQLSRWQRYLYRLYRHPLILFGIGPIIYFGVLQRWPWHLPRNWKRERLSVHGTNLLLIAVFAVGIWVFGAKTFLAIHLPILTLAASAGSWLFFVQHQFPETYWRRDGDWDYRRAALEGSSFLDLPRPLRWLTANIGYHHIHHLDSRIPYYSLPACHAAHADLQSAQRLSFLDGIRTSRLKIWDEEARALITFRQADRRLLERSSSRTRQVSC